MVCVFFVNAMSSQEEIRIWNEFVDALKKQELSENHIRPHKGLQKKMILETLDIIQKNTPREDWGIEPEVVRSDDIINYLLPLRVKQKKPHTYCFTLFVDGENWYLQHIEAIHIRLDKISPPPTSEFPDLDDETKTWMRQEDYWSKMVWLFNRLSKTEGKKSAMEIFMDGAGYFLAAKAWVPFVPSPRAFILYLCWEQSRLRGNAVSLEKLEPNEAVVKLDAIFFQLYRRTGHLKTQISYEDYRRIFETIWQDRAKNAGWNLNIEYRGNFSFLYFTKI